MSWRMFHPLFFLVFFSQFVFSLPAFASSMSYTISFTYTDIWDGYNTPSIPKPGDPPPPQFYPPLTASFNYDPASGFSDFMVNWYGLYMDLTDAANNPTSTSDYNSPPACSITTLEGHALGFAILSDSLTSGCPDNLHTRAWYGEMDKEYGYIRTFGFTYQYGEYVDKYSGQTNWAYSHLILGDTRNCHVDIKNCLPLGDIFANGSWALSEPIPEPGTLLLFVTGLAGIVVLRKKFSI